MIFVNDEEKNVKHLTVASNDQLHEVYGVMKPDAVTVLTVIFSILMVVFSVLSVVFGKIYLLWIFLPILAVLIISTVIRKRQRKKYLPVEPKEHPEAIFKDHEL